MKYVTYLFFVFGLNNAYGSGQILRTLYYQIATVRSGFENINLDDRISEITNEEWKDGQWQRVGGLTRQYNAQGVLFMETQEKQNLQSEIETIKNQYAFNTEFELTEIHQQIKLNSEWHDTLQSGGFLLQVNHPNGKKIRVTNSWDNQGKITTQRTEKNQTVTNSISKTESKTFQNGEFVSNSMFETEVDSLGRTLRSSYSDSYETHKQTSWSKYTDSAGLCILKMTNESDRESWRYDEVGNVIFYERDLWYRNQWLAITTTQHAYQAGKEIETVSSFWDPELGSRPYIERRQILRASPAQPETTIISHWIDDSGWIGTRREVIERDSLNQLISITFYEFNRGEWKKNQTTKYQYDVHHRQIQTESEFWNSSEQWIESNGSAYDTLGRLTLNWSFYIKENGILVGNRTKTQYVTPAKNVANQENHSKSGPTNSHPHRQKKDLENVVWMNHAAVNGRRVNVLGRSQ